MRLIDADAMIDRLKEWDTKDKTDKALYSFTLNRINEQPTIQSVQRGHWQEAKTRTYGIYECDVCKGWTYIPNEPRDYKFCPRCGARMDGEKE